MKKIIEKEKEKKKNIELGITACMTLSKNINITAKCSNNLRE